MITNLHLRTSRPPFAVFEQDVGETLRHRIREAS